MTLFISLPNRKDPTAFEIQKQRDDRTRFSISLKPQAATGKLSRRKDRANCCVKWVAPGYIDCRSVMAGVPCCHICEEHYDLAERDPVVLICGHTFCRNCMCQLALKNPEKPGLDCPECRSPTPIPHPFDPACFKRNYGLVDMLPGAHGKKHPRDQEDILRDPNTLRELIDRAREKVERLQRARAEASALTLDAIEQKIDAWGATLRRLVDDRCQHLKEAALAKEPAVATGITAIDVLLQELREALSGPSELPTPRLAEAIGQFQGLLEIPTEATGFVVDLPPVNDLLDDLGRVDVKRLLEEEEEEEDEEEEEEEEKGEEKGGAEEEPPLVFASPELAVALRVFSAVPPAQPLTRTSLLAWCRRLIAEGAPADGSCPAVHCADLVRHPAFADDHDAMRVILQAIAAVAPNAKGRWTNVAAAPLLNLLRHCPPGLLADLVRTIRVVVPTWELEVIPKWQVIRRLIDSPAIRESRTLLGDLLGILLTQLAKQQWDLPDYRDCVRLLAHLLPSPGFLVNYDAHVPFLHALVSLSARWERKMGTRAPEISDAFRVFAFLIVQLLRDEAAIAISQLSSALLETALALAKDDADFRAILTDAGLPGMFAALQNHPTIKADPKQGPLLAQLVKLFAPTQKTQ
ncbi:hypothetical protein PAPYR_10765 [Paratrimastix pyriformis]|uniref:RING-type domain-containing protein n=1 Tax=Paratrimastix pyriformis TaxID=342808 RepID=A0ABQ8UA64_9EUKA|nr:hypothetical protein PAPYR_10765 [Paratrimastix pyriformis]